MHGKKIAGLAFLLMVGCGRLEDSDETQLKTQQALVVLSQALESGDVAALRAIGSPRVARMSDAELSRSLSSQKNWSALVGSKPQIATFVRVSDSVIEVHLQTTLGIEPKALYFFVDGDSVLFSGPQPEAISSAQAAVTGVAPITQNWRYDNWFEGAQQFNVLAPPNPPGAASCGSVSGKSAPKGSNLISTSCTPIGLTCMTFVGGTVNYNCAGNCLYQWVGYDVTFSNGAHPYTAWTTCREQYW